MNDTSGKPRLLVLTSTFPRWRDDHEPVRNDICDSRARDAVGKLVPRAEKLGVSVYDLLMHLNPSLPRIVVEGSRPEPPPT